MAEVIWGMQKKPTIIQGLQQKWPSRGLKNGVITVKSTLIRHYYVIFDTNNDRFTHVQYKNLELPDFHRLLRCYIW